MSNAPGGGFTKEMARNIFYGGPLFFFLIFVTLVFQFERQIPQRSNAQNITEAVARGKAVWEKNDCIGCHTLLGEGAYCAPELGNVYKRRGGDFIKVWITQMMPSGTPGRRQMPRFNLSEQEQNDLVEFLKWTGEVNTENWPPNIEG